MNRDHYVQYGCGFSAPSEWRNFDASPTLRFERIPLVGKWYTRNSGRFPSNVEYGDIVKGLPLPSHSCRGVYCSHVLEHLALADFREALRNTGRLLEPGGTFRLVLPDLEFFAKRYVAAPSDRAAIEFMEDSYLGHHVRPKGLKGLLVSALGNSHHLWMWDYSSMNRELAEAGFTDIRRAEFGDSSDPMFTHVEEEGRWTNCLGMECRWNGAI